MEPIEQAIAAAEKDWSSLPFAKTDTTPFDAKKDLKPDPHAKTGYATVRGWNGKERLLVENIESRLPSGKEAEQRQDEIAGRLPGKVGAALGISEEEAKIKTRQFIALHELGHCKDYSAIKEALNAHSVGKYAEWSRQNLELAKAVPQDMSDAMKNGVNGNGYSDFM